MFLTLLAVTLLLSAAVAWGVTWMFSKPIERILTRIIADDISKAWLRYMQFATLVVGVSSGVRIHELERYITAPQWMDKDKARIIALTTERWVLEKAFSDPARAALAKVARVYLPTATPADVRQYLEGVELTAARAGLFAAGECEPVKRMVQEETGSSFRVSPKVKLKELLLFSTSEELRELRVAVGTDVEVQVRK